MVWLAATGEGDKEISSRAKCVSGGSGAETNSVSI